MRTTRSARWWLSRAALAVVAGLTLGVAIDVARAGGPDAWFARNRLPTPYLPTGRTLDVEGSRVYIDCRGSGSPTVVLESGLGTGASGWGVVLDRVAATTRVCVWDRPGIGGSEAVGVHSVGATGDRLRAVLRRAGERGPFVVVGHSLGAVYARVFAATHRAETAGVVLVDAYLPDVRPVEHVDVPASIRDGWVSGIRSTNASIAVAEGLDWAASEAELAAASIDGLPLELLFVDQRLRWTGDLAPYAADGIAVWEQMVGRLSSDHRLTIAANSGHVIQFDRPDLVVDAIRRLVDRARATG